VLNDCHDLTVSDHAAQLVETGVFTISRNGSPIGATFSVSSLGAATFTNVMPGDVRAAYVWVDRDVSYLGSCVFQYGAHRYSITLYQSFHLNLTKGYNPVFATFAFGDGGALTSDFQLGKPPGSVSWLFIPAVSGGGT
jgi:hypothetical protein